MSTATLLPKDAVCPLVNNSSVVLLMLQTAAALPAVSDSTPNSPTATATKSTAVSSRKLTNARLVRQGLLFPMAFAEWKCLDVLSTVLRGCV